jgi:hypothetical protein
VRDDLRAAIAGHHTFRGKIDAVLEAAHEMNRRDPSLAQFLGAVRVDMRRDPSLAEVLQHAAITRQEFFDGIVAVGVETGEIDPSNRDLVNALVLTLLIGLVDAVAADPAQQRLAIDAIYAVLDGTLIHPIDAVRSAS